MYFFPYYQSSCCGLSKPVKAVAMFGEPKGPGEVRVGVILQMMVVPNVIIPSENKLLYFL